MIWKPSKAACLQSLGRIKRAFWLIPQRGAGFQTATLVFLGTSAESFVESACSPAPHFLCNLNDQPQLCELLVFGQTVALGRACEAALRAKGQLVEPNIFGGLVDAALQQVLGFELRKLA